MVWVEILWGKIKIYEFKMTIFLMPMIFVVLIHARFNAETQWLFSFQKCLINMFYIGVIISLSSHGFSKWYFQKGLSSQGFVRRVLPATVSAKGTSRRVYPARVSTKVFLKGPAGFDEKQYSMF